MNNKLLLILLATIFGAAYSSQCSPDGGPCSKYSDCCQTTTDPHHTNRCIKDYLQEGRC